ncbi:BON domain-containing protein [Azomonas macrocytogenes]|uniref:Osmotically-inducible protein Y n=1 Tax=Azomonas macrocytogenes TaxID=69962 RepID=A0A839T5Z7_AZOMA|nr:BON domain-containing protein [Azomonas macrocytogenes]MBB3104250.1 hyperosmotically inducible protein [Azomonas macrocytogenes]
MKITRTSLTAAVVVTALGLPMAGSALADTSPAFASAPIMLAANESTHNAGEAVSDTWITTKVKSALLAEDSTPGLDIKVETKDGVVSLSGTVPTEAQREAAIAETKSIKGVRQVLADGLKTVE